MALLIVLMLVFPGTTEALFRRAAALLSQPTQVGESVPLVSPPARVIATRSSVVLPTVNCSCDVGSRSAIETLAIGEDVCVVGRVGAAGVPSTRNFSLFFSEADGDWVSVEAAAYGGPTLPGAVVVEVRGSAFGGDPPHIHVSAYGGYQRCISRAMPE
jgi:hypothetical protein